MRLSYTLKTFPHRCCGVARCCCINQLVRQCASAWFDAGAWDCSFDWGEPDADTIKHPQYFPRFMTTWLGCCNERKISRAGAGLSELADRDASNPFPYAAEDHQAYT